MPEPSQQYLDPSSTEDLGRMLMALVQEVWAMRDRMAVTERLLAERAGISTRDIDDHVVDAADPEVEALRERFVGKIIGAPLAARDRSVEQILARAGFKGDPARGS